MRVLPILGYELLDCLDEDDSPIALLAGELNHSRKKTVKDRGMADSVILATARSASAKGVTGDRHFEGLPDAIIV